MAQTGSFSVLLAVAICILSHADAHEIPIPTLAKGCPSILIVGASGYIGSFLFERLQNSSTTGCKSNVAGIDRNPVAQMRLQGVSALRCAQISDSLLASSSVVIYFGGMSNRNLCNSAKSEQVTEENVNNIAVLASRMHASQLLIFASSSAIADGFPYPANEQDHGVEASLDS